MNKLIAKFFSNLVIPQKAKIKFLGKRLHHENPNKHLISTHSIPEMKREEVMVKKPSKFDSNISPDSSHVYRPKITLEEIEIINNGGILNIKDWNKIKLKKKI